jgi:hypothetical protein
MPLSQFYRWKSGTQKESSTIAYMPVCGTARLQVVVTLSQTYNLHSTMFSITIPYLLLLQVFDRLHAENIIYSHLSSLCLIETFMQNNE